MPPIDPEEEATTTRPIYGYAAGVLGASHDSFPFHSTSTVASPAASSAAPDAAPAAASPSPPAGGDTWLIVVVAVLIAFAIGFAVHWLWHAEDMHAHGDVHDDATAASPHGGAPAARLDEIDDGLFNTDLVVK